MGFKPGHKKLGGRQKGTPNKASQDLMAICEKHGCDPFEGMVIIAVNEKVPDKKFDKLKEIAQYVYPKRKAIEHSTEGSDGFRVILEDYRSKE